MKTLENGSEARVERDTGTELRGLETLEIGAISTFPKKFLKGG